MEDNNEDKILGMNRTMFFVIVILLCILSLSIGIYAQIFYRYSDTDPFMLGVGIGRTQDAAEITKMKNEFNSIFTNQITGKTTLEKINKSEEDKEIVYTSNSVNEKEEDVYSISAYIPKINIKADYADKLNREIEEKYLDKAEEIVYEVKEFIDYTVSYRAYINGELLSLIIKETIREGRNAQSSKIATYNYNLKGNKEATIQEIADFKKYDISEIQKEINAEIENLNKKDEELRNQYAEIKLRDLSNSMYQFQNTENFIVNDAGYLYLIYAYGNKENTNKIDLIIFE